PPHLHSFPTRRSSDLRPSECLHRIYLATTLTESPSTSEIPLLSPCRLTNLWLSSLGENSANTCCRKPKNQTFPLSKAALAASNRSEEHTSELQSPDHL